MPQLIKSIRRLFTILCFVLINASLGLIGESFGYTVLDKIGIVFAAGLLSVLDTAIIGILTPLTLATLLGDPLLAWKVPSYAVYSLFLAIALSLLQKKLRRHGPTQLFISTLFMSTGVFLLLSPSVGIRIGGISLIGLGFFLLITYLMPTLLRIEISPQTLGMIMLLVAPSALVLIDLTIYSALFINVFSGDLFDIVKSTIYLMMIDSAGPLILYGILWLTFDLSTILSSTKGKINIKRQTLGLFLLLIVIAPVMLVGGFYMLSPERRIQERITYSLPLGDWSVYEMRMSYIWSPLGVTGTAFVTYPTQHIDKNSPWFQAGINLCLVRGKKVVDMRTGWLDMLLLQKIVALQFLAWLRLQGIENAVPTIQHMYVLGTYRTNRTYLMLNASLKTVTDIPPHIGITLKCQIFVTNIEELDRTGIIILYGIDYNYATIQQELIGFVDRFDWL